MPRKLSAIVLGAGHRAVLYASYAQQHPEELEIVGVCDLIELRRRQMAEHYGLRPDQCWESAEELAGLPQQADLIINGTMDHQHVPTSLPLLERGYDMLLVADFLSVVRGEPASPSTTGLEDSVTGHLIGFLADRANDENRSLDVEYRPA